MLVLSRKVDDSILLGPHADELVRVTVIRIVGSKVLLTIEAPRHIRIDRSEVADARQDRVENLALVASQGTARSEATAGAKQRPPGGLAPEAETDSYEEVLVLTRKVNEAISVGEARIIVVKVDSDKVRLRIETPKTWIARQEEPSRPRARSTVAPEPTGHHPRRTQSTTVAEILSRASSLNAPEELEELTAGLLALRAKRLAPVVSDEETDLLLTINEGVSADLRDRAASLIEKRGRCSLTEEESSELLQLADEVERRGVARLEALSKLAELRGLSLRELMSHCGI